MTTLNPVVVPVDWSNADAVRLRAEMAAEVGRRYAGRIPESLRDTTNAVDPESVQATLVVYVGAGAVGHAAVRWNGDDLELKRMYVAPTHRGTGTATALLDAAESAARAAGVTRLVLQTGDRQPDAIRFYERSGYQPIPVFPPYDQLPLSRCYARDLGMPSGPARLRRWLRAQRQFLASPAGVRAAMAGNI